MRYRREPAMTDIQQSFERTHTLIIDSLRRKTSTDPQNVAWQDSIF